ncbi:toast rack family protein [Sporosarcina trichiuri]|uniref:toast rack family protein n=1 Tax=Sporosarcina trichiuri TaxID=3056445 RepID=UPI0025B3DD76|nr:toast rack family protein [Sporosarcina sp. 0.2-SM1T-5]WJY26356.1 toast rack family protein [Sporosarcina sp. 0.2-SM1T-5]
MRKYWIGLIVLAVVAGLGLQANRAFGFFLSDKGAQEVDIGKDAASSLNVDVTFGAGNLQIEGGAEGWAEGVLDTNVKKWRPSVRYREKKGTGHLTIHQKMNAFGTMGKKRNDWTLRLTDEIPVDLRVDAAVAEANLDLAGIRLSRLSVDAGVGDMTVNLAGDWQDGFDAKIDGGVGDLKVLLPKGTGVRVTVDKGLGTVDAEGFIDKGKGVYVNEAYEGAETVIELKVDVGIGAVKFVLAD